MIDDKKRTMFASHENCKITLIDLEQKCIRSGSRNRVTKVYSFEFTYISTQNLLDYVSNVDKHIHLKRNTFDDLKFLISMSYLPSQVSL